MHDKTKFFKPRTQGDEGDRYGQNILTDGDRIGEIIPSLYAWMPPEAMRERAKYHKEVTEKLARKSKKGRQQKAHDQTPIYPTIQSDQNRDTNLEVSHPTPQRHGPATCGRV